MDEVAELLSASSIEAQRTLFALSSSSVPVNPSHTHRMQKNDVMAEAEVYLAYGKHEMAISMLEYELRSDSARDDIRERIEELKCIFSDDALSKGAIFEHHLVGWGCFLIAGIVTYGPCIAALKFLEPFSFNIVMDVPYGPFWMILALALLAAPLAYAFCYINLYLWLSYLRELPAETQKIVDIRVPPKIRGGRGEPMYSRMHNKFFGRE